MTIQYYYRTYSCPVKSQHDSECICWHDEKTGPCPEARDFSDVWESRGFQWREKPKSEGNMIDVTRVKKTRCGHPVRIYATDGGGILGQTIHGAVLIPEHGWIQFSWFNTGRAYLSDPKHDNDLIEEPEVMEIDVWLNVYSDGEVIVYRTRIEADANPSNGSCSRFARIPFKRPVEKGEGL